jgi:hypothetical protein
MVSKNCIVYFRHGGIMQNHLDDKFQVNYINRIKQSFTKTVKINLRLYIISIL